MRTLRITSLLLTLQLLLIVRMCTAQNGTWATFHYPDFTQRYCLTFDHSGTLWAAATPYSGTTGVGRFDGTSWHNYGKADGLLYDTVNAMTVDRQGRVWTAGKGGVCYYDGETGWHSMTVQDSLSPGREFFAIVCDSSGNIWTSSWSLVFWFWLGSTPDYKAYSEIHKWDGHNWTTYDFTSEDPSFAGVESRYMTVAPNGTVWAVNTQFHAGNLFYGGLRKFDGDHWSIDTLGGKPLPRFRQPSAIECDKDNNVWIGYWDRAGEGALDKFDGTNWIRYNRDWFYGGWIRSMKFDHSGRLWIGGAIDSLGNGANKFDGITILNTYTHNNSALLGSAMYSTAIDHSGNMWFSSEVGISELKNASSVSSMPMESAAMLLTAFPNPFHASTNISYTLPESGKVDIIAYNLLGERVAEIVSGKNESAGLHKATFDSHALADGIYHVVVYSVTPSGIRTEIGTNVSLIR